MAVYVFLAALLAIQPTEILPPMPLPPIENEVDEAYRQWLFDNGFVRQLPGVQHHELCDE